MSEISSEAPFIGVQLGSHSVFDEGAEHCLDLLQRTGRINAVIVYSHSYQNGFSNHRTIHALADDHGIPVRDPSQRNLTGVFVQTHDEYYGSTVLRHKRSEATEEYADKDVIEELLEPASKRGMKVLARILEGADRQALLAIPNWTRAQCVDIYGRLSLKMCWNSPDYRNWWLGTVEDLFKTYPLDGLKYGAERGGPLSTLIMQGHIPTCFCQHCMARGRAEGIDVERARQGWEKLYEFVTAARSGKPAPPDGLFFGLLRILFRYPEILQWDKMWYRSKEEIPRLLAGAVHGLRPGATFGVHVHHNMTGLDPFERIQTDYAEMAEYCDWIKPVVYHDITGPRLRRATDQLRKSLLGELSGPQALALLYAINGYDAEIEPGYEELMEKGLGPEYVYRETRRCVEAVAARNTGCTVYAGVGFDIPDYGRRPSDYFPSAPETVYKATLRAFEAGANGLVVSREYDEMRVPNLEAVGRAVTEWQGRHAG
jgi:hypothetical protein